MKSRFFYFLLFLTAHAGLSQPANPDISLTRLQQEAARFQLQGNFDSAKINYEKMIRLAGNSKNKKAEATALHQLADMMQQTGRLAEMKKYDSSLLQLLLPLRDTAGLIAVYNRNGVYFQEMGKKEEAESNYKLALGLGLERAQSEKTAEVYSNLGSVALSTGDKDKASDWFFKALRLFELYGQEKGMGETYSNISSVFYLMGKTDDAIAFQQKSIAIREKIKDRSGLVITYVNIGQLMILKNNMPQSQEYLLKAVQTAEELKNPRLMATAYSGMTAYAGRNKQYAEALAWQNKAIRIFEETGNKQVLSRLYVSAGNMANATQDSVAADSLYRKAWLLSKELGNKENIANAYEKMSNFYLSRKNYAAAYEHYKNFMLYRDSINAISTLSKIEEIRTKYETEKKDNEISRLSTLQRLRELEIEKQNAVIAGNLLEAKQKQNEIDLLSQSKELQDARIASQEEELVKKELIATASKQQLELAEKETQLQEKEISNQRTFRNLLIGLLALSLLLGYAFFNRYQLKKKLEQQKNLLAMRNSISQDLHDDIGASLSNINILNELARRNLEQPDKSREYLSRASEDIQRISESLSDIVWNINPKYDEIDNLFIRMKRYAADMLDGKQIRGTFDFPPSGEKINLSMTRRRDLYLVFKEAVNNLVKYSGATEANISIRTLGNEIILQVKDNGKGFIKDNVKTGNGLANMQERALAEEGYCRIESAPGKGTLVELRMKTG